MRKRIVAAVAIGALLLLGMTPATAMGVPEACVAVNPGAPVCEFTATAEEPYGGTTGVLGPVGDWLVTIKRGKKTFKLRPGPPDGVHFVFQKGDRVKAEMLTPGWVLVGHN